MRLILRVANSRLNSRRTEEARQLLRTTPALSSSLIQRIALSTRDSQRAKEAREMLKAMREPSTPPRYTLPLSHSIAANDDDRPPPATEEVR